MYPGFMRTCLLMVNLRLEVNRYFVIVAPHLLLADKLSAFLLLEINALNEKVFLLSILSVTLQK